MKKLSKMARISKNGKFDLNPKNLASLQKTVDSLVEENNRKNDEIRQIKKKLRVNAHFSRK